MKNKLFTLAAALMLAAVIGSIYAAPALAAVIKAALIKNVDEPGRSPFQENVSCGSVATLCTTNTLTVDLGKRLVIEHISGGATVSSGDVLGITVLINSTNKGELRPNFVGITGFGNRAFEFGEQTVAYVGPGETVKLTLEKASGGSSFAGFATITGYLVDLGI